MVNFRDKPLNERQKDVKNILAKYPNHIPICIYKNKSCKLKDIDKDKYLVPNDLMVGQFLFTIRKRINLSPTEALFLFFGNDCMVPSHALLSQVYKEHVNKEDGMLYAIYSAENTFG